MSCQYFNCQNLAIIYQFPIHYYGRTNYIRLLCNELYQKGRREAKAGDSTKGSTYFVNMRIKWPAATIVAPVMSKLTGAGNGLI